MKKTMKVAAACAVLASPAVAANLENPLYIPKAGEVFSKTGAGYMYKRADATDAMKAKLRDGKTETPIWRLTEDIGVGITDRLSVRALVGYTYDGDIDRKGLHEGRLGLNYRVFEGAMATSGWVWDLYADAFLGGASKMEATLVASPHDLSGTYPLSFDYANYSNGRWGAIVGTQAGKTWDKFTAAAFVEAKRSFGNDNTEIKISDSARGLVASMVGGNLQGKGLPEANADALGALYSAGLPNKFSVETGSVWDYSAGLKGFYEIDSLWAVGAGFTYKHRAANSVESVKLKKNANQAMIDGALPMIPGATDVITEGVEEQFLGGLKDGWDEYILSLAVSRKLTDNVQVALYGESTMDRADRKSQNGTDVKVEAGVRVNVSF